MAAMAAAGLTFIGQAETCATHAALLIPEGGIPAEPGSDWDGDGRSNLHEYLFGTNLALAESVGTGTTFSPLDREISYRRRSTARDTNWRYELSTDLSDWKYNGDGSGRQFTTETSTVENGDGTETVTVQICGDVSEAFIRVVGTVPAP